MNLKQVERIAKALSDPCRITILQEIKKNSGCLPCSTICEIIDLSQPSISHHLKQLTDADLVIAEKEGRTVKYILNKELMKEYTDFLNMLTLA